MWFRKKSVEMRIAESMEKVGIPFFPLPIMNKDDFETLKKEHEYRMQLILDYYKNKSNSQGKLNG